ncbi:hypothetical protein L596_019278 [Steinernema carpocapsae]|uniref:Uncharacterized protein n=1 Tax=Steinernema carpocapsae TaxID=34508 RepID=A0A4U5MPY7_STECR|nr:hypothetical protein L596_019278 [Steinernema carpocapsae]
MDASQSDSDVGDGDREVRVERDDSSPLSDLSFDGDGDGDDDRSSRWAITFAAGGDGFLFEGTRRTVASVISLLRFPRGSPRITSLGSPLRLSFVRALGSPLSLLVSRWVVGVFPSFSPSLLGSGAGGRSRRLPSDCPEWVEFRAFIPLSTGSRRAFDQELSTRRPSATIAYSHPLSSKT